MSYTNIVKAYLDGTGALHFTGHLKKRQKKIPCTRLEYKGKEPVWCVGLLFYPGTEELQLLQIRLVHFPDAPAEAGAAGVALGEVGEELRRSHLKIGHDVEQLPHRREGRAAGDRAYVGAALTQLQAHAVFPRPFFLPQLGDAVAQELLVFLNIIHPGLPPSFHYCTRKEARVSAIIIFILALFIRKSMI